MKTILDNSKHTPTEGIFTLFLDGEKFQCIVAKEHGKWHASISHDHRDMTYSEIKSARYILLPNEVHAAMIFPPREEFVNLHPFCFHLYEI